MYLVPAILFPVLALANPLGSRDTAPPADQITILSAQSSGNGCPQGSVSNTLSKDRTVVTFGFDSFQTYIGPTALQADKTKQCQIHLSLQYPGGFQYSVVDATYHGWARLDPGVTGTFISSYFFSQAASQTASTRSTISGPQWANGDIYTKEDSIQSTAVIWSPCGASGILNVNNRIALSATNSTQTGELSDDDATVAFTQQLHVSWQPCTPGAPTSGGQFQVGSGVTEVTHG